MLYLVLIALLAFGVQCLLPAGLALLAIGWRKRHEGLLAAALLALTLFMVARPMWSNLSPIEWLFPGLATKLTVTIPGYRIKYYQEPSTIFFREYIEIHDAYGDSAKALVNADTNKCWFPTAVQTATTLEFVCQEGRVVALIDLADMPPPGSAPHPCLETMLVYIGPSTKVTPVIGPLYC